MTPALDPTGQHFIEQLLSQMTLSEKIGQMTQPEKNSVKPGDVARLGLGSVLSGGGGNPEPNTPASWRAMVTAFIEEAQGSRLKIPLIYGSDAVHGHNNVVGATIFPHNIGLGCTRDADLLRRIGRATALEAAATNVRWSFAPAVSIPQDIRWGRSYEGYSQDTKVVTALATALVEGLKGEAWNSPTAVLPSVKHFIADAATTWGSGKRTQMTQVDEDRTLALAQMGEDFLSLLDKGAWQIDQGNAEIDEQTLREVHLPPYKAAIDAGALNVMVSYSSWQGLKMHAHHYLLTEVLKGELGFEGFIVSDWEGVQQVDPDFDTAVVKSVNAGVDMVMVPFEYERFIGSLTKAVEQGQVKPERIDDAVHRILTAKYALGLFEQPQTDPKLLDKVGCAEHRAIAREAAAKSAVLLKNEGGVLPLRANADVLVAGPAANDIGLQCGGWTITWMGGAGPTTPGTTILAGLQAVGGRSFQYDADGTGDSHHEIGLVFLSEEPYAEGMGDRTVLQLSDEHLALLGRVKARCQKLVVVLLSGRPLVITEQIRDWDAFVAAWLPGSEGDGLADVLCGVQPFSGRLSFDWPGSQADVRHGPHTGLLFQLGDGL